ncbi:MAG: 2-C-methyl-D-erythritol 4-phosphate cytidylyltransferase [Eubacterium ventriosum]
MTKLYQKFQTEVKCIRDRHHSHLKIKKLKSLYGGLSEEEKTILTDAAKIFVIKGEKVHLVEGEVSNTKITYPYDLRVAETLISEK